MVELSANATILVSDVFLPAAVGATCCLPGAASFMKHEEVSAPATDAQIKALEQCVRNLAKRMGVPAESVQVTGLTSTT